MYDIPVKVDGIERRRRIVGLFHIMAGLFLLTNSSLLYKYLDYSSFWPLLPVYLIAIVSLCYAFIRTKVDPGAKYNKSIRLLQFLTFLVLAIFVFNMQGIGKSVSIFLWAIICLALSLIEQNIFKLPAININTEGLIAPMGISYRTIYWDAISDIVIRQDYITINYINNQYLQYEIQDQLTAIEIEQINLFCRESGLKAKS